MSIKNEEIELFNRWISQRDYVSFTFDGVFDEETYKNQDIKILYILKEADWPEYQGNLNLKEYLLSEKSSSYWKTWNNIARWTKGIVEGGDYPRKVSKKDKTFWMKRVSFIELKKEVGGACSKTDEIAEYAKRDKEFIKQQIEIYCPDIIICCGRGNGKNADLLYYEVFDKSSLSDWQQPLTEYNYNYYYVDLSGKKVPVVSFVHPQMRGGHNNYEKKYKAILEIKRHFFD